MLPNNRSLKNTLIAIICVFLPAPEAQASILAEVLRSSRSIVKIEADFAESEKHPQTLRVFRKRVQGAGIIIHETGLIAANAHTVKGAARMRVFLHNGKEYKAVPVYLAGHHDLVFLKIEDAAGFPAVSFGDPEKITLHSSVYTVGSSVWLQNTVSEGKITGLGQPRSPSETDFPRTVLLQIGFDSYPGDSGSPIFDSGGRLLGMTVAAKTSGSRDTLALSSAVILYFLDDYYASSADI